MFPTNQDLFDADEENGLMTTTIAVEGMTCGACTSAVEGGFKDVPGVKNFSISLLSERAVIEHDPTLLTAEQIAEIIEDRGFGAEIIDSESAQQEKPRASSNPTSSIATTTVAIEGMTCGACTSAVEGGFKEVEGVLRFNISLLAERAVITHDTAKLPADKIAEIIEDRGFGAEILSTAFEASAQGNGASSTAQFKIYGSPDASTAMALEAKLLTMPGINSAKLSLATSRLTVTHQPSLIGLRGIVEAVEAEGLNALVSDNDDNNAQLESLAKTREINEWRRAFKLSLSFAIPVLFISMILPMCFPSLDFGSWELLPGIYLGDLICLALTIPVQFGIGRRFYISGWKSIKHGSPTMDVLVILGTSCAFFFSIMAMLVSFLFPPHTRPATIFDTSTMLITFVTLGRFLENRAKGQTSKALSRLIPQPRRKRSRGEVGDVVILRPGEKIPADGTMVRGETYIDESMVTGEAMPVQKKKGSYLIGGTVNGHGRVDFRVTRAGRDTQLSQIVKLVQDAQTTRAPIQRLADTLAGYFVPAILILGFLTFLVWMILSHALKNPPKIFTQEASGAVHLCHCLCLSMCSRPGNPTAVMVGTGIGAENGILVKGGAALETTTRITQIVLDKTGTITYGKMSVAKMSLVSAWQDNEWRRRLWWHIVGLAEMGSEHPVGRAVLGAAKTELGIEEAATVEGSVGEFKAAVGKGINALVEPAASNDRARYRVLLGNVGFLRENNVDVPAEAVEASEQLNTKANSSAKNTSAGTTNIFVAIDGQYTGHLCLSDTIKEGAAAAIAVLHRMKIKTAIVTGDQRSTAVAVAAAVGISPENVYAGVSPDQKQAIIQQLQDQGEVVGMVGDGINDSPALATADVGIAMASGTDVAMEAADVVLMRPTNLMDIPAALHLARSIFNRIKLNLAWACMYNAIGLPFAMGVFLPFGFHLHPWPPAPPWPAAVVVVSSLLLKFWTRPSYMLDPSAHTKRRGFGILNRVKYVVRKLRGKRTQDQGYVPLANMADRDE
ncbi:LOW QUALITY PROTEIN: heavy metal translocating P-type ATPase [Colletotrichum tofieldiae]|nr:LOW QUALITY PROTEIN: heavy metal translocating P-type ATPase [Colletotrichum tofieldiae]